MENIFHTLIIAQAAPQPSLGDALFQMLPFVIMIFGIFYSFFLKRKGFTFKKNQVWYMPELDHTAEASAFVNNPLTNDSGL